MGILCWIEIFRIVAVQRSNGASVSITQKEVYAAVVLGLFVYLVILCSIHESRDPYVLPFSSQ